MSSQRSLLVQTLRDYLALALFQLQEAQTYVSPVVTPGRSAGPAFKVCLLRADSYARH